MRIVRRLQPGEGPLYRALRLEALRESPAAFSSRYEDALARSDQSWADQAHASASGSDRATFVAWEDQPVGLVALYRKEQTPQVGELLQMWVAPAARGGSVATDLLEAVFQWARTIGLISVQAEVVKTNARALRFYVKCGFTPVAHPPAERSVLLIKPVAPPAIAP